jgi:L-threonylcarbamoyladenylate synthase
LQDLDCSKEGIERCAAIIRAGGVVIFPTDTIYGIGCDPYNDSAVGRIFSIKGRDEGRPLPVLVGDLSTAEELANFGPAGKALAAKFWPGALTIVAPLADRRISPRVTAARDSLAVRVPSNACALELLARCRCLVGTSANSSGGRPSRTAQEVTSSGLSGYDALLAGKETPIGAESTIVDVAGPKPTIIREGAIKSADIMRFLAGSMK